MSDDPNHRGNSRAGSARRSRTACAGSRPTTSTSTRSTVPTRRPTSARRSTRSPISSAPARSVHGAPRRSPPPTWSRRVGRRRRGVAAPHSEQPPYSIMCRGIETEVLPTCRRHGIGVIVWSPLSGGWLTGKYQRSSPAPAVPGRDEPRPLRRGQRREVRRGRTPRGDRGRRRADDDATRVGLVGRASRRDRRTHRPAHERTARRPATAADVTLDADVLDAIDEVVAPVSTQPGDTGWTPPAPRPVVSPPPLNLAPYGVRPRRGPGLLSCFVTAGETSCSPGGLTVRPACA